MGLVSTEKFELSYSYLNNQIGQKMFAYIYDGEQLSDNIKAKFKKSLIFLGKEGQIYNPLTATYVGIGTTAYTNLQKYAQDIEDKVDALNQALTSSMVSSIYANFDSKDYKQISSSNTSSYNAISGTTGTDLSNSIGSKVFATNEIILKGIGDYDPVTHAATTKLFSNIVDSNLTAQEKEYLAYSYLVNGNVTNPFATSGITVSLVKGRNKYRFNFTGIYDATKHVWQGNSLQKEVFVEAKADDVITDRVNFTETGAKWDDNRTVKQFALNEASSEFLEVKESILAYEGRINGGTRPEWTIELFNKYYDIAFDSSNEKQLFKNGKNTFTIDDKLTWSYIASAYAYTLDFAKKHTTSEVNRIYAEILGLNNESALIPVDASLLRNVVADNSSYVYNSQLHVFEAAANDPDHDLLHKVELNSDTTFFKKVYFKVSDYSTTTTTDLSYNVDTSAGDKVQNYTTNCAITLLNGIDAALTTEQAVFSGHDTINLYSDSQCLDTQLIGSYSFTEMRSWDAAKAAPLADEEYFYQGPEVYYGVEDLGGKPADNVKYGNNYFLVPVTVDSENTIGGNINLHDSADTNDYVIINKFKSATDNVNLADGINTLKEAAYILDWITNGGMDPENPEASGIEMAYSIAQNHIDIQNLHTRLREVEGGTNVVKNIDTLVSATNDKYVKMRWTSDIKNVLTNSTNTALICQKDADQNYSYDCWNDATGFNYEETTANGYTNFYLKRTDENVFEHVLISDILSYNLLYNKAKADIELHNTADSSVDGVSHIVAPTFADTFGPCYNNEEVIFKVSEETIVDYIANTGSNNTGAEEYVGQVKLGVDVITATTYTMHQYGHTDSSEGFVVAPFNTINKDLVIDVRIPAYVNPTNGLLISDLASINANRYDAATAQDTRIKNATAYQIDMLLHKYGISFDNLDSVKVGANTNIIKDSDHTLNDVTVNISVSADFENTSTVLAKIHEVKYTVASAASAAPFDGKLYTEANGNELFNTTYTLDSNELYYFRYSASDNTVKFAETGRDALATTEWVEAHSYHTIKALDSKFAEVQHNAYNFAKDVISQLDSNSFVPEGHVISGVKLTDGHLSLETREQKSDNIFVSTEIWGENYSNSLQKYDAVTVDENFYITYIKDNVGLYIQNTVRYEQLPVDNTIDVATAEFSYAFINIDGEMKKWADAASYQPDIVRSIKLGTNYASYIPVYQEVPGFTRIDNADLTVTVDAQTMSITSVSYTFASEVYNTLYVKSASAPRREVKYLDANIVKHDIMDGGTGEQSIHLTAHVTKLEDANENNSGFADAYDIKNTLDNLFEWVDLSKYTDGDINPQNPGDLITSPTEAPTQPVIDPATTESPAQD